jgi:guanylate kinase
MSIVFIISEIFGPGRGSVVNPVREVLGGLDLAIPYTTRTPGVADNQNSRFVFTSLGCFELMIAREEFLEHVKILGNYYGTPYKVLQQAQDNGHDLLVQTDYSGAEQIKGKVRDAVSILILPVQSAGATTISSSAINPSSATLFRELLLPSVREVFSQRQVPHHDRYDHIIFYDRTEDGVGSLVEIIRKERLHRRKV